MLLVFSDFVVLPSPSQIGPVTRCVNDFVSIVQLEGHTG
jgi:hypothetical protein